MSYVNFHKSVPQECCTRVYKSVPQESPTLLRKSVPQSDKSVARESSTKAFYKSVKKRLGALSSISFVSLILSYANEVVVLIIGSLKGVSSHKVLCKTNERQSNSRLLRDCVRIELVGNKNHVAGRCFLPQLNLKNRQICCC